ncbi:MAG: dynamin family protein [Leptolyngbyaceae bacterium]|nr:dynamin family protein [Leptolyngbyaceae bacterium]
MSPTIKTQRFLQDLDRVAQVRSKVAQSLRRMITTIEQAEASGRIASGALSFDREMEDLANVQSGLEQGVFRLLVLGDMKRGKSTFLNALMGENVLPSDVNPCTAILTVLRYGPEKQVTVHFNDGKSPEVLDFKTFKQRYTIDPSEAKQFEESSQDAFPDVSHAVVTYPLPLLQHGVEIVDSPGLNDTEARNQLSLGYLANCHAVLFVLRATQPCTLGERRYLENYIKDRGLSVFFLVNAWDQVKESLIDPDDAEELEEAEDKLRRVFRSNLAEYCQVDGYDLYEERVFELSSLMALRRRVKDADASLDDTGFPPFMAALNTFLTQERAVSEMRQARLLARQVANHVGEAVARRIPLLDDSVDELKERIESVKPEFTKLSEIRDRFRDDIREMRDKKSVAIADSFKSFVMKLEDTFEQDFVRYQPQLNFFDFLSQSKREEFEKAMQEAFRRYANEKFAEWTRTAQRDMTDAFSTLSRSAEAYGASYSKITDTISSKLTGRKIETRPHTAVTDDKQPAWTRWAVGAISLARGNIAGVALAGAGFDWENILLNFLTVTSITVILQTIFGAAFFGPLWVLLMGLGLGVVQADQARQQVLRTIKKELAKYLPQVAQEQWHPIYNAVRECFEVYEKEVVTRIEDDIDSRQAELDNLLTQKESKEVDRAEEVERLKGFEGAIATEYETVETAYQNLLSV